VIKRAEKVIIDNIMLFENKISELISLISLEKNEKVKEELINEYQNLINNNQII